ncbi:MAG: GNAT family N-acetyltransferase [Silicimonas sp.]|nr:GNAT family N-acetyltransferase [Silicimonas sp.]
MTEPATDTLFAALEASWPPARVTEAPPFRLREGRGGGQRVSSALPMGPATGAEIEAAERAMEAMGQHPLFMLRPGDEALDAALEARGYRVSDPTLFYAIRPGALAEPSGPGRIFPSWPPLAVQREIWAEAGVDAARFAVMERAACPKTAILARIKDTPAAAFFLSLDRGIAMLHALEVRPAYRRKGLGGAAMRAAATWAEAQGAEWLALAVVAANAPAIALYEGAGLQRCGGYHYRRAPEAAR